MMEEAGRPGRWPKFVVLLAWATAATLAAAQTGTVLVPPPYAENVVYVTFLANRIARLDAEAQTMYIDFFLLLSWVDPGTNASEPFDPETQWSPSIECMNVLRDNGGSDILYTYYYGAPKLPDGSPLESAGLNSSAPWVNAYSRVSANFFVQQTLRDFPFDTQRAVISIESQLYALPTMHFRLMPGTDTFMVPPRLKVAEWNVLGSGASYKETSYPIFNETYHTMTLYITMSRKTGYYTNKVIVNIVLLVYLTLLATAWGLRTPDRFVVPVTTFVALISWLFVLINDTPRTGELTRLDELLNASFAIIFIIAALHAVGHGLQRRLDKYSRATGQKSRASLTLQALRSSGRALSVAPGKGEDHAREQQGDTNPQPSPRKSTLNPMLLAMASAGAVSEEPLRNVNRVGLDATSPRTCWERAKAATLRDYDKVVTAAVAICYAIAIVVVVCRPAESGSSA